jgi:hypothetical protein
MSKINVADIITYALFALAVAMCGVGVFMSTDYIGMIISGITGLAFLGILVAMIVLRVRFKRTYKYWTRKPVRMGFRGKPCWDQQKSERWIEAVIVFWTEKDFKRKSIEKALDGLTVFFRPSPWSYFGRLVVGVAGHQAIVVKYEKEPWKSAFAHELGHVIIGKLTGDWNEATSHTTMKNMGFTNGAIKEIVDRSGS